MRRLRVTDRLWKLWVLTIVVIAVSESAFTIAAFWSLTRRGIPQDIVAQRLLLAKWLVLPFLSVNPRIEPYIGGGQRYLGELTPDSPAWIDLMAPDALLGRRLGRNITAFESTVLGEEKIFVYVTNDEGFASLGHRDFHYGLARPARRYRVMIVGGSTVMGWGAGTPDRSLPARINSLLERDESNLYEVVNAGVPGYDSAQEFLYVASELIHYKPDLLIVYDGWNDEFAAELDSSRVPAQGAGGNLFKTLDHLLIEERFTASYSVLGSARLFAGTVVGRTRAAIRQTATYWLISGLIGSHIVQYVHPGPAPKPPPKYDPARVRTYEDNLTNMLNLAHHHGVRVALFLQPIMWIDGRAPTTDEKRGAASDAHSIEVRRAFYAEARPMFARLRERHQQPAHVCIEDLSHVLEETTETIYVDSGHLGGRGNEIVADEMVKRLAICGVLTH